MKTKLATLVLLTAGMCGWAQETIPVSPVAAYTEEEGLKALDRHDYAQAEQIFTKLTADNPKDFGAWFNLGTAEAALGKNEPAIADFQKVLALKPDLYEAELNLGLVYGRMGNMAEAEPHFEAAVRLKPGQVRTLLLLADSQLATGKDEAAAKSYEAVVKLDPTSARGELGWGQSLLHLGQLDDAAGHYKQAATIDPKLKSREVELAAAYANAKKPEEAIAILKGMPDQAGAAAQLGTLYLAANQPALAVEQFEAAVKLAPTPANQMALVTAYLKNNQEALAAPILEKFLAANPNDYEVQMTLGRIWRDKKEYRKAIDRFLTAAKLKPNDPSAWSEIATACVIAEMYPEALGALEQLHRLNAEKPGHYYLRAIVLDKLRQIKPALENYRRFLELSQGKSPDEEFKARQRVRILEHEVNR